MSRILTFTISTSAILLTLTQQPARAQSGVQDTTAAAVADCQLLGPVTDKKYSGFLFIKSGVKKARKKVRQTLGAMGATHVVWGATTKGVTQSVTGVGYRCK